MDAFFNSAFLVAAGEIGDKTQLLAILLVARYRHIQPVIWGILAATLLNHAGTVWVGEWIGSFAENVWFQWSIAASFILIGLWVLKPDTMEEESDPKRDFGAFLTTLVTFFIAEIGDKTQIATVALAAEYKNFIPVLAGTTTGMLIADVPAVFFGEKLLEKIPVKFVRYAAAAFFIGFGCFAIYKIA